MKNIIATVLLSTFCAAVVSGQNKLFPGSGKYEIKKDSFKDLPKDLKDETILFLKFDSVKVPAKRPKGYDKFQFIQYTNHNEMVPKLNNELREHAAKYPYKYKIISMMDKDYAAHGAKYLFWMNSFEAFTEGVSYGGIGSTIVGGSSDYLGTALGIVDLTASNKKYLISWTIGLSRTYMYDEMIRMLNNKINKQFN